MKTRNLLASTLGIAAVSLFAMNIYGGGGVLSPRDADTRINTVSGVTENYSAPLQLGSPRAADNAIKVTSGTANDRNLTTEGSGLLGSPKAIANGTIKGTAADCCGVAMAHCANPMVCCAKM